MGVLGDILLTVTAVGLVVGLPLAGAFGALTAVWLLVPPNLSVPHAPHILLVHTVVLYAFCFRLMARHGPREPRSAAYVPTLVHAALLILMVVLFFDGVVFTPAGNSLAGNIHYWFNDFNLLVLFVVVLAVVRTISLSRAVGIIVVLIGAVVGIGLLERATKWGWSAYFFEHLPVNYLAPGSAPLQTRGGHVRSQGAAQFALEYGWVVAMLLPLLVVSVFHWSRARGRWFRLVNVVPLLAVLAVVFSGSRSALVACGAVLVLVVVIGGNREMVVWGALATLAGAITAIADPSLIVPLLSGGKADPASVRLQRLGPLFDLVHHPFTGLGLSGISSLFVVSGVDDGYAVIYATLGVIGVIAWLAVIVMFGTTAGQALAARRGSFERLVGAACVAGVVAAVGAVATYDFPDTAQSTWTLVVIGAVGVAAAEAVGRSVVLYWSPPRLLVPAAGGLIGLVLLALAPLSSSMSYSVMTDAPWVLTTNSAYYPVEGTEMVSTLCPVLTNPDTLIKGTKVRCLQYSKIFPLNFPGWAVVQVRGPTPATVRREAARAFRSISGQMSLEVSPIGSIVSGKPAWARTAPLWGAIVGAFAMMLVPPILRSRRRHVQPRLTK